MTNDIHRMTTLSAQPTSLHASLIEALNRPDPETALEQAFIQLSRGGNLALLMAMIKALVRCGLAGIAARLLRASSGLIAAEPQLANLAVQLEGMPSGEIAGNEIRRRVTENVNALLRVHPTLAKHISPNDSQIHVHVFLSVKGNYYVVRGDNSAKLEVLFPFGDQIAHAAAAKLEQPTMGAAYLLIGVPSVPLWRRLCTLANDAGYLPPIYVVETEPDAFIAWLACIEDPKLISHERMRYFIGPGAVDEFQSLLIEDPHLQPPTNTITSIRPRWQPPVIDAKIHQSIQRARTERNARLKKELEEYYSAKDAAYWRERFSAAGSSSRPLRIAGMTSRFSTVMQHAMRDLAAAFRKRGCEFELIKQPTAYTAHIDVVGEIHRLRPDLIIVINHLRSELADAIPANIPYVCWIQDYMQQLWNREAGYSVSEFDLVLGHSPAVMTSVYGYPADRFLATHNLTSSDTFSAEPVPDADLAKYRCDLSYVGHGWETPEQLVAEMARDNAAFGRCMGELLALVNLRLAEAGYITTQDLVSLLLQAERTSKHPPLTPEARRSLVVPCAQRLIDRILRHQTLHWAAEWAISRGNTFRIFGNGWERHPTLNRFASGVVDHGYPLRCVYQASTVSLQVNAYGSLHQRLLDGVASGTLMLTRYNPADFIRRPHLAVRDCIQTNNLQNVNEVLQRAKTDQTLHDAIALIERLTGTRIASIRDPQRAQHVAEHVQCASLAEDDFSDEGLFRVLRVLLSIPHRTAEDIDGFGQTTFTNKEQMHELLDRYSADTEARRELVSRMRQSVLRHDTYDSLVRAILDAWRTRFGGEH